MNKLFLLTIAISVSQLSFSQVIVGRAAASILPQASEIKMDHRSKAPVFISFKPGSLMAGTSTIAALKKAFGMREDDSFHQIRTERDELGMNHSRYQQFYRGIKVETGQYIVHEQNGNAVSANGMFYEIGDLKTIPDVTVELALKAALKNISARKYIWEYPAEEALIRQQQKDVKATWHPKGELVILPQALFPKEHKAVLCWKFDVYATAPLGRYYIYVDAGDGNIIYKENRICTIAVSGTGNTKYNGTQSFTTDSVSAGVYHLRDNTRAAGVETYNLQNSTAYGSAVDFTDADNVWTSVTNQDNAALDAHWGAEKTYDYYLNVHGRNSYDNAGSAMRSYVHYSNAYNNAFWDGVRMTYGDGDGTTFSPLTELDICGHELTHGVTANSSALIYSNESGALNESFSDIFGKTIDFYVNPSTANWKIGAKCYTPGTAGDALRYMDNPNADGSPDTYHGTNWYSGTSDNGGVHTNSGVQNFWYYLLVNGGSGINDVGFNYAVTGIGIDKARRIAYRNNTFYLPSSATYADAAFYALKSANDLFGSCSPEAVAVKNAWDAVGVFGLQLNTNAMVAVTGSTCLGGTIQLAASGGTSFLWNGPSGFASTQQNPSIFNASANEAGVYSCMVTDSNGCSATPSVNVLLNNPPSVNAGADVTICKGIAANLNAVGSVNGAGGNTGVSNTTLPIPDNPAPAVFSNINISGALMASALVSVTIDSLTHTWDGDLDIRLIAPDGSEVALTSGNGGSGDNYLHTKFTSGAASSIATGTAPFNGTFLPDEPFSNFTGPANGTWKLKILDLGGQDVGTLWKWSLVLTANTIVSYSWSPATGLSNASINNPSALPSATTTYSVKVTDAQGCNGFDSLNVNVANPVLSGSITNASCGSSNGIIDLTVSGLNGPNIYNWSNGATTEDISGIMSGVYTVTVTNGSCSTSESFTVQAAGGNAPSTPGTVSGPASACRNQNGIIYSVTPVAGATSYNWVLPVGVTGSSNTETISVNFGSTFSTGNICVGATNNCGSSLQSCITITRLTIAPSTPSGISGSPNACVNTTQTYSVIAVSNATIYNWTIPANTSILSGAGTNSIQLSFNGSWSSGSLLVNAGNCIGNSSNRSLALRSLPATPASITGDRFAVCGGTTHPYSTPTATGAISYVWTFPSGSSITGQGTTSVQITFPSPFSTGNVTVKSQNTCGSSTVRSVSVRSIPSTPGTIGGPVNNNCGATAAIYSVAASTTGATSYTWAVPAIASITSGQSTNSIHVSFTGSGSGTISVHANNACGSSSNRTLSVTTLPAQPAAISGPATVCLNQTGIGFSVVSQAGVNYNWTVPAGASIVSGQTTPVITVNWGSTAGNVGVIASNSCGNAANRTKAITLNCRVSAEATVNIQLFPNPATDNVILQIDDAAIHNYIYELIDMLGNHLETRKISSEENNIYTGKLARGIYMVQLKNENGIVKAIRLVLQ